MTLMHFIQISYRNSQHNGQNSGSLYNNIMLFPHICTKKFMLSANFWDSPRIGRSAPVACGYSALVHKQWRLNKISIHVYILVAFDLYLSNKMLKQTV